MKELSQNIKKYNKKFDKSDSINNNKDLWNKNELVTIELLHFYFSKRKNNKDHSQKSYLTRIPISWWPWFINNQKFINMLCEVSWENEAYREWKVAQVRTKTIEARKDTGNKHSYIQTLNIALQSRVWNRNKHTKK